MGAQRSALGFFIGFHCIPKRVHLGQIALLRRFAHIRQARQLLANRSSWHNHWDDLAWSMLQRRIGFASSPVEGERRTDHLV